MTARRFRSTEPTDILRTAATAKAASTAARDAARTAPFAGLRRLLPVAAGWALLIAGCSIDSSAENSPGGAGAGSFRVARPGVGISGGAVGKPVVVPPTGGGSSVDGGSGGGSGPGGDTIGTPGTG